MSTNDHDHDDGGGWETAPTRQSKKKSSNAEVKSKRSGGQGRGGSSSRGTGGRGQSRGRGGGGGGFGGWAKPKPPQPKPNADWPSPPQSHYTSQQSEMLVVSNSNANPNASAVCTSSGAGQNMNSHNNSNSKKELTYLDAVPKRELTDQTLTCSADSLLQKQAVKDGDNATSSSSTSAASTFQSMLKKTSLTDLMADYGEEDRDFAKMVVPQQDNASKPNTNTRSNANATKSKNHQQQRQNERNGVLAPHGKAPIHIELVSYGHHYGVPSEATGKGGYSRSRPLPPFDVRDLDRAPHHVAKLSGLSHHVKRELLNPREIEVEGEDGDGNGGDTDTANGKTVQFEADKRSPVRRRTDEVAQDSATALAEAIQDGYGHASPLDMTVYIGSEYGRHRSVVIVEAAAISLRNMLRKNEQNRFGSTPVSVGTRHRDVDRAHRDEEAFGYDLRREAQAAKKQKEREERESEGRW